MRQYLDDTVVGSEQPSRQTRTLANFFHEETCVSVFVVRSPRPLCVVMEDVARLVQDPSNPRAVLRIVAEVIRDIRPPIIAWQARERHRLAQRTAVQLRPHQQTRSWSPATAEPVQSRRSLSRPILFEIGRPRLLQNLVPRTSTRSCHRQLRFVVIVVATGGDAQPGEDEYANGFQGRRVEVQQQRIRVRLLRDRPKLSVTKRQAGSGPHHGASQTAQEAHPRTARCQTRPACAPLVRPPYRRSAAAASANEEEADGDHRDRGISPRSRGRPVAVTTRGGRLLQHLVGRRRIQWDARRNSAFEWARRVLAKRANAASKTPVPTATEKAATTEGSVGGAFE
jgi:hypothetical protein